MRYYLTAILLSICANLVSGVTFQELVHSLDKHESSMALREKALALDEKAKVEGSWGDPSIRWSFRNFPKDSLRSDETPMTGVEWSLSQKIPLTTKYGNKKKAFQMLSQYQSYKAQDNKRQLVKLLWNILIEQRRLTEEKEIFKENLQWIDKMLTASKKLYSNGKLSGRGLLDIQIRKAEIESLIEQRNHEQIVQKDRLRYIFAAKEDIDLKTIPWSLLEKRGKQVYDKRRSMLESLLKKTQYDVMAAKQSFIPDIDISLGYTKRANIDQKGDFLQASVAMHIPLTKKVFSEYRNTIHKKLAVERELADYDRHKASKSKRLSQSVSKILGELGTLEKRIIPLAENAQKITSTSYELGGSGYLELLQTELKLQQFLLKKTALNADLAMARTDLKHLLGEPLYE